MEPLLRPDNPGYFLEVSKSRGENKSSIKAELVNWLPSEGYLDTLALACRLKGVLVRCDRINRDGQDDGTRYFPANPPQYP